MEKIYSPLEIIQQNVLHEQLSLIHQYVKLIFHWNKKINITSRHNTKHDIYDFICEGIAITKLLGEDKSVSIVDVGSGAGFPGIVLNILGYHNCSLIEINTKKAAFLQYVTAELNLNNKVYNSDVRVMHLAQLDFIVSKAVSSTKSLITMCDNIRSHKTRFVLCKNNDDASTIITLSCTEGSKNYKFLVI